MINLLKIDLYKMFRTKSLYIIAAVLVVMASITSIIASSLYVLTYQEIQNFMASSTSDVASTLNGVSIPGAFSLITSNLSSIITLAAIFIVLFMCSEFSYGTIKNIASKGYSREKIYLSKFICGITCTVIYCILIALTNLIVAAVVVGDKIPNYFDIPSQFWPAIALALLLLFAYQSVALMLASLIRNSGASIGTFLGLNIVIPLLLPKVDDLFKNVFKSDFILSKYTLSSCLNSIVSTDLNSAFSRNDITTFLCVGFGFLTVALIVGLFFFRKRDI